MRIRDCRYKKSRVPPDRWFGGLFAERAMIMAKIRRKKKQAVYHNTNTDRWTNDTKEQLSLMPGSDGYEARQQQLAENTPASEEHQEEFSEEQWEQMQKKESEAEELAEELHESFIKGQKSPAAMQYRAMVQRQDAVRQTAKIASQGLGRTVTAAEIEDAAKGATVLPEDVPKALKQYEPEFHEREVPVIDTNGDGQIDEDDAYMTPGMSRMRRYL